MPATDVLRSFVLHRIARLEGFVQDFAAELAELRAALGGDSDRPCECADCEAERVGLRLQADADKAPRTNLIEAIEEIRRAGGSDWDKIDDPAAFLGRDEPHATSVVLAAPEPAGRYEPGPAGTPLRTREVRVATDDQDEAARRVMAALAGDLGGMGPVS